MIKTRLGAGALSAIALMLLGSAPARADRIYGDWCYGDERLHVELTTLVTPGGSSPPAQIDRHSALYAIPDGERDAGATVMFRQLNDDMVARHLLDPATGQLSAEREIWEPCKPPAETS